MEPCRHQLECNFRALDCTFHDPFDAREAVRSDAASSFMGTWLTCKPCSGFSAIIALSLFERVSDACVLWLAKALEGSSASQFQPVFRRPLGINPRNLDPTGCPGMVDKPLDRLCCASRGNQLLCPLPQLFIGPVAGAWIDRHDKLRLLLVTQRLRAAQAAVLVMRTAT